MRQLMQLKIPLFRETFSAQITHVGRGAGFLSATATGAGRARHADGRQGHLVLLTLLLQLLLLLQLMLLKLRVVESYAFYMK